MFKKVIHNKISLSLLLTALILLGTVFSPLQSLISFSATNYNVENADHTRSSTVLPELSGAGNLLYNRPYHSVTQTANGADVTTANNPSNNISSNPLNVTDGKTETGTFFAGKIYYNDDGTPKNTGDYSTAKDYTDLTYSFAKKSTVHEVWIYHAIKTSNGTDKKDLITRAYQIYLSDSIDTLYTADSLVYTGNNTDAYGMQKIKFTQAYTNKQFIGVRFLVPAKDKDVAGAAVARIHELAAFGTTTLPEYDVETANFNRADVVAELKSDDNLLYNREFKEAKANKNGQVAALFSGDKTSFTDANLLHKDLTGAKNLYFDDSANPLNTSPYLVTKYYSYITYQLEDTSDIDEIWVYGCDTNKYSIYAYQVFLSYTEENLYTAESLVATYENTGNKSSQKIKFKESIEKKQYFGIRFLMSVDPSITNDPAGVPVNDRYIRFAELAVFGEAKPELVKVTEDNYSRVTSDSALTTTNNLIYNREYNTVIQYDNGKNSSKDAAAKLANDKKGYTDGDVSANVQLDGQIYYNSDGTPKNTAPYSNPKYYTCVTYFLGGKSTVNEVWVYNCHLADLTTYVYQIYLSDSRDELYNSENHIYTYTNTNHTTRQKFEFPKTYKGTYFGIKILLATAGTTSSYPTIGSHYARLTQLAVFGTVNEVTEEDTSEFVFKEPDYIGDLYKKYKRNLVKGYTPKLYYNAGAGEKVADKPNGTSNITNENVTDQFFCGQPRFAELVGSTVKYYDDGTERYFKLSFNLRTSCEISHILFVNCTTEELRTLDYEIYLSDSADTLFNSDKRVKHYQNTALDLVNNIEFSEAKTAQYVGFKIIYPTSKSKVPHLNDEDQLVDDVVYTRINEIAIFGDYTDPDFEFPPSYAIDPYMTNEQLAALGDSIVAGQMASCRFTGTPLPKGFYSNKEVQFTDGDITTHVDVNNVTTATYKLNTDDGSQWIDIIYDWNEVKYDITGFLFAGCYPKWDDSKQYYTGHYQVSIADDLDDLFLPETIVFEYIWDGETYERGHLVNFDSAKRGAYFAIRILNPVSGAESSIGARVAEIAVYGEKANIPVLPTNLATNMPVEAYTENSNGELTAVSTKALTASEIKNLTDGDKNTSASFKADGTVQLIYNLCNDAVVDTFRLTSNAKKYKVYAASDMNDIWSEDSLVYTYNGKGTNGKTLTKGKNVRYVRFEISNFGNELKISEIECIGGDNQLLKYKKLSRNFDANKQITLSEYDPESKSQKYILTQYSGKLTTLFDSGYKTPTGIWGGTNDEVYLDFILNLDDVRNIDKIALSFPQVLPGYSPTKLKIYTSEELGEFEDGEFDLSATASYDGKPILGTKTFTFAPRLARTILVRFICGDTDYDPYLNNQMTIAITEVEVSGTAVKGTQKDKDNKTLLTFKDKKTGITVDIQKYDDNDIFTKAYKLKVEKVDATTAQKKALTEYGSFKIIGNSVYKVTLVDVQGNPLTSAGGREVIITFPCDTDKYGYPILAQDLDGEISALDIISEDSKHQFSTLTLDNPYYMLAAFANPDDPYFENLDVEIPEDVTIPGYENFGEQDDNIFGDDSLSSNTSPATGEKLPVIIIAMLLIALSFTIALYKKPIK